ncbi:hypothetical protein [Aeromonas rivipollensis]
MSPETAMPPARPRRVAGNNRSGLDAWQNSAGYTLKQSGFGKKSP